MSISLGLVYIWFGALKFFPTLSPAEELASETISILTFGLVSGRVSLLILAVWELLVGVTLVFNYQKKWNIGLGIVHILGTFLPFLFLFGWCFGTEPLQFTLVGQYIFKNILFLVVFALLWQVAKYTDSQKQTSI